MFSFSQWKALKQGQLNVANQVKMKIIDKISNRPEKEEKEAEKLRRHNEVLRRKIAEVCRLQSRID